MEAQSYEIKATELLQSEGFEEIRVLVKANEIICTIENSVFRSPSENLQKAFGLINSVYRDSAVIRIILLEQGAPVYQGLFHSKQLISSGETVNSATEGQITDISFAGEKVFAAIKKEKVSRPVRSRLELVVYPQVTMRDMVLGDYIYEKQFNLAPALKYSPFKGMLFTGQVIFPILNQLDKADSYIRPGFVTISQRFVLPRLNQLKITAGSFNYHRYGFDLKWKKNWENSRWSLAANVGLTGYSSLYNYYWKHSSLDRFTWNVTGSYYLPFYQMRADLKIGQFLFGDRGFRADVYRHFGEVTIGFYAYYTGNEPGGGFHFAVPLNPFIRRHKHPVQVSLASYFDMEYNYKNAFVYGRYYETSPDENRSSQDIYPQHIYNRFINP